MTDGDPHVLRATFDSVADVYERARPVAPAEVFDDVVALTGIGLGAQLLEVGCGTGQATLPMAERGYAITAVELGAELAEVARRKLAGFPAVEIVTSAFEEWDPEGSEFDAVYSFNAFHWIDDDVRFSKTAAVLRGGGSLAVYGGGARFVVHEDADPVWLALDEDYVAVTGSTEPRLKLSELRDRSEEFTEGGYFSRADRRLYRTEATYDADGYLDLLATVSWYTTLAPDVRNELFERIRARIAEAPGGTITPTRLSVLYVAKRT